MDLRNDAWFCWVFLCQGTCKIIHLNGKCLFYNGLLWYGKQVTSNSVCLERLTLCFLLLPPLMLLVFVVNGLLSYLLGRKKENANNHVFKKERY